MSVKKKAGSRDPSCPAPLVEAYADAELFRVAITAFNNVPLDHPLSEYQCSPGTREAWTRVFGAVASVLGTTVGAGGIRAAALRWCEQDKVDPDAPSLGKDLKTRTALENREIELRPILEAYFGVSRTSS